jgi:PAS domain S-box-containing protein
MDDYERLEREELISLLRRPMAKSTRGQVNAFGDISGMPVFGEREWREFDTSPWAIRISDRETLKYLAVNDAALKLYGYAREEFLALTVLDTRHPEDRTDAFGILSAPAGYFPNVSQRRHAKKSGEIMLVEVVMQDILFNGHKACLSLTVDITEQTHLLEMGRTQQSGFGALIESTPDIISRIDRNFRHLYVNPAITVATGRSPAEFIGKTIAEVGMPLDLVARWDAVLHEAFATECEQNFESTISGANGERYYESRVIPERIEGNVKSVLVITRDFTERKYTEQLLRQREWEFEKLAENIPDLVARFDHRSRYIYVNNAVENLSGIRREGMLGRTPSELGMPSSVTLALERSNASVICNEKPHTVEFSVSLPDGERFFEAHLVPEKNHNNRAATVLCVARDITERKKYERAMQRNLSITQLLGSLARAANEAKTPEAAMSACLEHICLHGGWELGRVAIFEPENIDNRPLRSVWYAPQAQRFHEFIRVSNKSRHNGLGNFISRALREQTPVWIEDLQQTSKFGRKMLANSHGLKSGFAFPIILHGTPVAILELFSVRRIPRDPNTMDAAQTIAFQLSQIVERERTQFSNARLASIVEFSQDAIISRAVDGTILTWNLGAERLFGYSPAEMVGQSIDLLLPFDMRDDAMRLRAKLMQGIALQDFETVRISKDGRRIDVSQCVSPIRDSSGVIVAVSNIMRDITGRKQAEREFQRQKKLLETIIDNLPVGIAVKDAHSLRYLLRNRLAHELTGISSTQAIGKRADEIFSPELAELIHASDMDALASSGAVMASPMVVHSSTGRIVRNLKVPVPDEAGRYAYLVGILDDVTDIEKAQADLRRSERRLSQLISMSPVVIFSFSPKRPFCATFVGENVAALLGWRTSDFTDDSSFWSEHIHPDDQANAQAVVSRIVLDGKYRCEYRFRHKDGGWRWMRDEGRTVFDEGGATYEAIGSWTDVTSEHVVTEMRVQRALLQRDTLVREVHHRIKNSIQGVIGLLRRKSKTNPRSAPAIHEAVMQLQTIAMVYGLEGKASNGPLSLAAMLDSICGLAGNLAGDDVARTYQSKLQQPLHIAVEEAVAVAVALNELIFNALKHQASNVGQKKVRIALREDADIAEIRITNCGRLPPDFDFQQGRGVNEGLDLVKVLLLQPGSDVVFNSLDGEVEVVLNLRPPLLAVRHLEVATRG